MIRVFIITLACFIHSTIARDFVSCSHEKVEESPSTASFLAGFNNKSLLSKCKDRHYQSDAQAAYTKLFKNSKTELKTLNRLVGSGQVKKYYKTVCKKDITCVLTKIYGNKEVGQRAMIIKKQFGYTVSYKTKMAKTKVQWIDSEMRDLHRALILIPEHFHQLYYLGEFRKVPKGEQLSSTKDAIAWTYTTTRRSKRANTPIYITHRNFKLKEGSVRRIIHELAHQVDSAGIKKNGKVRRESSGFSKIGKWKITKEKGNDKHGNPTLTKKYTHKAGCFITRYAEKNPKEHFAESFAHYIDKPKKLKKKCPKVYEHLKKNFFKNVEYPKFSNDWCSQK